MSIISLCDRWKHLKTGAIYTVFRDFVIDCTNSSHDKKMILYTDGVNVFTREAEEFYIKFIKVEG